MFTGLVEELGVVRSFAAGRLTVACRSVTADSPVGASIAVGGTCLTVVERGNEHLSFELSRETCERTTLGAAAPGMPVNLERAATLSARLGGHLVQGHVDGIGEVVDLVEVGSGAVMRIRIPTELGRYAVQKGSIAVDGVSLTIADVDVDVISIALIPHTLAVTTLGGTGSGDRCNLEADVIAKYVERLMEANAG